MPGGITWRWVSKLLSWRFQEEMKSKAAGISVQRFLPSCHFLYVNYIYINYVHNYLNYCRKSAVSPRLFLARSISLVTSPACRVKLPMDLPSWRRLVTTWDLSDMWEGAWRNLITRCGIEIPRNPFDEPLGWSDLMKELLWKCPSGKTYFQKSWNVIPRNFEQIDSNSCEAYWQVHDMKGSLPVNWTRWPRS